jgi:hypothetical protein
LSSIAWFLQYSEEWNKRLFSLVKRKDFCSIGSYTDQCSIRTSTEASKHFITNFHNFAEQVLLLTFWKRDPLAIHWIITLTAVIDKDLD